MKFQSYMHFNRLSYVLGIRGSWGSDCGADASTNLIF
jgi:hypothetical protein